MDRTLIDQAARVLQIRAVLLRSSSLTSAPDILPPSDPALELAAQFRSTTETNVEVTRIEASGKTLGRIAVVVFSVGVRLVDQKALSESREGGLELRDDAVKLEIKAEFAAHYALPDEVEIKALGPALAEFCRHNVGFHVWPYWREFVQSTCTRMGFPPVPVPMYQVPR